MGRRASPAKCQLLGRREAAAARAAPALPCHSTFIGVGSECGRGTGVPASPGPLRARPAPASSPGAALRRARGTRSTTRLRTGDLVSPPALAAVDARGGGQEQANPAPPGAQRGNGLPAARPATAAARVRPAGTRRPSPGPRPAPARLPDLSGTPGSHIPAPRPMHPPPWLAAFTPASPGSAVPSLPSPSGAFHPGCPTPPGWKCRGGFGGRASTHPAACARRFRFGRHSSSRQRGRNVGPVTEGAGRR